MWKFPYIAGNQRVHETKIPIKIIVISIRLLKTKIEMS